MEGRTVDMGQSRRPDPLPMTSAPPLSTDILTAVGMSQPCKRDELTELTTQELAEVAGGFLAFTFKLVAVKTISWAHDDQAPKSVEQFN
jgi:hypothetical protein